MQPEFIYTNRAVIASNEGQSLVPLDDLIANFNASPSKPYFMTEKKAIRLINTNDLVTNSGTKFARKTVNLYELAISQLGERFTTKIERSSTAKKELRMNRQARLLAQIWLLSYEGKKPFLTSSKNSIIHRNIVQLFTKNPKSPFKAVLNEQKQPVLVINSNQEAIEIFTNFVEQVMLLTLTNLPNFDANENLTSVEMQASMPEDLALVHRSFFDKVTEEEQA